MRNFSDRWKELFEDESEMGQRAGEVLSIDRTERIPWADEIAERFNEISAEGRTFSRNNRLPLTWGWFLEKLETEPAPMEKQAFALIGEVWELNWEERGLGVLVDAMFADKGRDMFFTLLCYFPRIEEKLVRNARTAKYLTSRFIRTIQEVETPKMRMVGAVLEKWLIFWKDHPGGILLVWNYVEPYFCWAFHPAYCAAESVKEKEKHLRFLEELVAENEEAQRELTEHVLSYISSIYTEDEMFALKDLKECDQYNWTEATETEEDDAEFEFLNWGVEREEDEDGPEEGGCG